MKRNLFKVILIMTLVLSLVCLSSCTKSNQQDNDSNSENTSSKGDEDTSKNEEPKEKDMLAKIKEKGEIIIATEGTWAPWTYHDEKTEELVGFDVEIAKKVAEKIGVKATFVECDWDGILAGFDVNRYDLIANGMEITDERSQKYDFSKPYGYIRTALIVQQDNDNIKTFEDLKGKKTANTITSTYAALAEKYGATVSGVDSIDQTIDLLLAGRIDATLNAEVSYYDYIKVHPDAKLKVAALTEEASQVAFPVKKGQDCASLIEAINKAIEEMDKDGTLAQISIKYFGSDITKSN